ncbi:SapC family protein [Salipiger mangrovisoli]|uniref:SapC family protein n=1 Tax=Salipiger mangrovisoli TaxID=2865933 RepID=A0ABR9X0I3_9RHOB|nr:SapC family protein [Salipiger mangrovisoli]MBE9636997.1 SapC family protein [Salipiger mangrovisoli]
MATQLLFYEQAVPVTAKAHGDLSIRTGQTYRFATKVNSVPLTAIEFSAAAAHYPIVFAGTADKVMPAVILGVKESENFYVDAEGKWTGGYIPAFVRRYPFVFATDKDNANFILHVDETFEGCNRDGKGERLFDSDGNQTQYLQNMLRFLQEYQGQFRRTEAYCKRLMDLDLLQPMQAQFNLADGARRSLSGFMAINREKLRKLGDEDLRAMFDTDELECTFLHLHSMRHFNDMIGQIAVPPAPPAAEAAAPDAETPETEDA